MSAVVIDLAPQINVLQKRVLGLGEDDGRLECDCAVGVFGRELGVVVAQPSQTHAPAAVHLDHHGLTHAAHSTHRG
ncbi:MAG TPA: hypothetical protein VLZ05_07215 [Mycobacterium sp.]|nr:hypothetical protein [Mycobacterium sp.]HUH68682.1 hypothetical protein [Mycobacterium sp.]